jgi:phosphoribosylformylglycinamidine cyclo-ligase
VKQTTYKDAGVDIAKSEKALKDVKAEIRSTFSTDVLTDIGSFGGMFRLDKEKYREPILVSSTDGVGTKLKIAFMTGRHDTVGEDLVNHCVNDIAVGGAHPMFFLDYFAMGRLEPGIFISVIKGFVRGCKNNRCALIGGETAEMPDLYSPGEYDLSGTIVGIVEKDDIINGQLISEKQVLIGIESNGLHTNGYSLARKVLLNKYDVDSYQDELGATIGDTLLRVHRSYYDLIQNVRQHAYISGIAHITGGGIVGNTRRLLPPGLDLDVNWSSWEWPAIFKLIQRTGNVPLEDMRQTFNLGIGLIFIVNEADSDSVVNAASDAGLKAWHIGVVSKA